MQVTLNGLQLDLLQELYHREGLMSLSHCVKGQVLAPFQTRGVAHGLITKGCVFNVDTGLGKTSIAAGLINCVQAVKPGLKWVYVCQCSNLSTTARKLESYLFRSDVIYCDSTEDKVLVNFCTLRAANADVLILSYEAISKPAVESFLFRNRDKLKGVILDESQMLSNLTSHTSRLLAAIMNTAEYRFCLSATPLRINIDQVINQVYMVDHAMFSDESLKTFSNNYKVWEDGQVVGYRNLEELAFLLLPRMYSVSRSDLGLRGNYVPRPFLCKSNLPQDADIDTVLEYKCLSTSETMKKVLELLHIYKASGKRGLIYANRNTLKRALLQTLSSEGFSTAILDGTVTSTQSKKDAVHQAYLAGEYDVLISNITTGKDMPSDFIIFYELTFDYKQFIGRGERGLVGVDLNIDFVMTDSVYEPEFFYRNVYQRGLLLEQLCGKDLPELHQAVEQIQALLSSR